MKLQFIEANVYPKERTWHNWLRYEGLYRAQLDVDVYLDHGNQLGPMFLKNKIPTLFCCITPNLAARCYLKWNSNNNNAGLEPLHKSYQNEWSQTHFEKLIGKYEAQTWTKVLNVDSLFSPKLNRLVYISIVEFFGLEDNYDAAQQVHELWYNRQIESEKEMIRDLGQIFDMTFKWPEF